MKPHAWLVCGALLAALSVTMGAFGAHGLKEYLEAAKRVDTFETAARYHMYHAIALVLVGLLASAGSNRALDKPWPEDELRRIVEMVDAAWPAVK